MRCRELDIFKNFGEFFWNFWEFLENFLEDFFGVMFLEKILGGFYWDKFFWRNFLGGIFGGGIFWEEIFGRNSLFTLLKSAKLFESEMDWCFCQDFVSMEKKENFQSLEAQRKLIALKK